jgi:hypothetical protein
MAGIDFAALAAPFHPDDLEWRVQTSGERNGRPWALVLTYITNRAIQDRLDAVVGPENWRNTFAPGPTGGVMCGISVRIGDEWVTKWDGAENTDVEAVKGGLSAAMKRAAVQWGIGRYLYRLDESFAQVSEGGRFRAKAKDGTTFRWDPPSLPAWALPEGVKQAPARKPAAESPVVPDAAEPAEDPIVARAMVATDSPSCPKCDGPMWDNRLGKKNPKAPDYRCRDRTCDGVVWPPKGPAAAKPGAVAVVAGQEVPF